MEKTHDGRHGEGCFGCRIQTVQLSPAALPTRRNTNPPAVSRNNAYERGVPTDHRGMPYLGPDLQPIGQKAFDANRHRIEQAKRDPLSVKDTKDS